MNSDQILVQKAVEGDPRAFDLLVIKYQKRLVRLVSRYVRSNDQVLDVVQEAFIKAYRALPNFRGDSQFYTWLYRIAINTALNHVNQRKKRQETSLDEGEESGHTHSIDASTPLDELMSQELGTILQQALSDLPDDIREAFCLREYEGLSYDAIADIMQCPIGTVRSRIFRARESLTTVIQTYRNRGNYDAASSS